MPSTAAQLVSDFTRYANLIEQSLARNNASASLTPESESATAIQVERGIVLRDAVTNAAPATSLTERLILVSTSVDGLAPLAVVDRSGHHRPVYRPLLAYAWLQAFRIRYETLTREQFGRWDEALRVWADLLESELHHVAPNEFGLPAALGGSVAEAAWTALALHVAGKVFVRDAWTDLASDAFGRLTRSQQPGGAFLASSASDNPELTWYHELSILHAAASYAVQAEDRTLASAVRRATTFHLNETQPDHATAQPWGLFAFVWNDQTRSIADAMLHNVTLQDAADDGVSQVLLADALYCLRLFL
jgi:hypothetical protein